MAHDPVRLAEGVWRIPTLGGSLVNTFVLEEPDGRVALVDAGYRRVATRRIVAGLAALGRTPADVSRILITHGHNDHVGDLRPLQQRTGAPVYAHSGDAGYISEGKAPPGDPSLSFGRSLGLLIPLLGRSPAVRVDQTFAEGDVIDAAGGVRVLHTPGHSPGHCSLLVENRGVLITGDALFNFRDRISYSFAHFCSDYRMAQDTADRLGEVDYEVCTFMHGPEIRDRARERVREFLRRRVRES